jgi:hypothetical protein
MGHTGAWQGFQTAVYRYPQSDLTVIVLANLAQARPGAIAQGIAGILEPSLQPPHLLSSALEGPKPRLPIEALLSRISQGTESTAITPQLSRFLAPATRKDVGETVSRISSWAALGCDRAAGRGINWLNASIEYICYARGSGATERVAVSVFYTRNWRAAHFDYDTF